ncbi:hypothetical protein A3C91_04145 [Candidatus Azambacteria bacterium RIFCSPHIGHO2_02_FULL_52_12]|uniref:MgtC/SapB/SrpB/YhiD N-terminal domain-containing protein n=1 Tax=Candidatus Azambacteria bacterium RIFCSPLOWO2_01_FULL_46_25 TaxID=1797298 RepID=A0A1F5BUY4_9BACT|nr:MAG: hypothetical protein A3C91_04145 [Candidatus Azambacteria bacterium RIFCSPHIGHO2_02_FULL_52_12]OGD34434.1 MAG: hypothetical protein A2988_02830 [Candidatus Azambacteria bacterium RIFCSPLOWO2_01_FULL_46_25]OGD37288.1 MAG: hypothetical protein A2850_01060 [Candidatus Azambacteria bacterium RIFCSPHIGHO2_01_FULL_51_74]
MYLSLLLALFLGFLVGVEREFVGKEAGIKTYSLVSFGAALFTVLSFDPNFPDPSRMISQIIIGIGFIGGGLIIFHENKVHGLTTAASLWAVAGIGIAAGMRYYALALFSTALVIVVLYVLRRIRLEEAIHKIAGIKDDFK